VLLPDDEAYLKEKGYDYEVATEGNFTCVVIRGYPFPTGLEPSVADLLIRLPAGWPDATPDMFWCDPEIRVVRTGQYPQAASHFEQHLGRRWQRFSRHLRAGQWTGGGLEAWMTVIAAELRKAAA
jgi:Prokaryotic E2 family E